MKEQWEGRYSGSHKSAARTAAAAGSGNALARYWSTRPACCADLVLVLGLGGSMP